MFVAGAVVGVLVAFAAGYGYHRDELYFVAAGERLAWGYADQGPLTPLIARAMSEVAAGSLTVLRLPSALAAGLIVLLTGMLARELGGSRRAGLIAAACAGVSSIVLVTGHLLSTSTFDLAVRAVRTCDRCRLSWPSAWLAGVAIAGPRRLLRTPQVWAGAAIALALWSPWLLWQADRGWPQLDVADAIAEGGSTSSEPWWAIVPFQVLLVSPILAPVWIAGLVGLFRDPALRSARFLGWAWVVLAVVFMATAGKPYYLAGLLPALIGAGALKVDGWLERGRPPTRRAALVGAVALSGVIGGVIALPVLPADRSDPVLAVNDDVGETIGWPELAWTVARVHRALTSPDRAVILTGNYGQAGAIDRYGSALGLPPAHSGHNAYGDWGPPPAGGAPVIVVGRRAGEMAAHFRDCAPAARIDNHAGVDNEERGAPVVVCSGPRRPWAETWPALRHLG